MTIPSLVSPLDHRRNLKPKGKRKEKMKKLVKIVTIIASISAMLNLVGCGNSNTPEAVALKFAEKLYSEDFEGAGELCTKETATLLLLAKEMAKDSKEFKEYKGGKFEVAKCKVEGDSAIVELKCTQKSGKVEMMQGNSAIALIKHKGDWKVNIKKD